MLAQSKTFGTRGPVDPAHNYIVPRTAEVAAMVLQDDRMMPRSAPTTEGAATGLEDKIRMKHSAPTAAEAYRQKQ